MTEAYYTHARWVAKDGAGAAFVAAWEEMGEAFAAIPGSPALTGTLIESLAEPGVFYSFGAWPTLTDIERMRADPGAKAAMEKARALCVEASPGAYRVVAHVSYPAQSR